MEEFSDVEDGEDPYYPETERVLVTVTRSGRKVFAPQRLVVDPYIIPSDEDDDGVSIPDDDGESDDDYSDVDEDEDESVNNNSNEGSPWGFKTWRVPVGRACQ